MVYLGIFVIVCQFVFYCLLFSIHFFIPHVLCSWCWWLDVAGASQNLFAIFCNFSFFGMHVFELIILCTFHI